ncbi:MAG TPA: STAS domain-containing protein [Solirubrobacterales bacterium]
MAQQDFTFEIDTSFTAGKYVVCLKGELDLSGSPQLEAALLEAEQSHAKEIVVDLDELTFVDSSGLTVLFRAADRSATNGNKLRITPGRDQVASVLRLTGLDTRLPFLVEPGLAH